MRCLFVSIVCAAIAPVSAASEADCQKLHEQALQAEAVGNKTEAEHLLQAASAQSATEFDHLLQFWILDELARLQLKHGKSIEAEATLRKSIGQYESLLESALDGRTEYGAQAAVAAQRLTADYIVLGSILTAQSKLADAISLLDGLLARKDKWLAEPSNRRQLSNQYVLLLRKKGLNEQADAFELKQEVSEIDVVKWNQLLNEAITLVKSNRNATAIHELKVLDAASDNLDGKPWRRAHALRWLGQAYANEHNLGQALSCEIAAVQLLQQAKEEPLHKEVSAPYCVIAEIYLQQKQYPQALDYARQAYQLLREQRLQYPQQIDLADNFSRAAKVIAACSQPPANAALGQ